MSLANNNLRISHESLNMDDIISELNPVSSAPSIEQAQSHNAAADNR